MAGAPTRNGWVCPNDRGLCLLAKLGIGWSVKSQFNEVFRQRPPPLTDEEMEIINKVIEKAGEDDLKEQKRIGYIVERLENIKRSAIGYGQNYCFLCGERCLLYKIFMSKRVQCSRCGVTVCSKCGVETNGYKNVVLRRCKICSEEMELLKKSGAWFYWALPSFILPEKKTTERKMVTANRRPVERGNWSKHLRPSGGVDSSSSEEDDKTSSSTKPEVVTESFSSDLDRYGLSRSGSS